MYLTSFCDFTEFYTCFQRSGGLDSCGFTFENFVNFFTTPPASFQLGCIFLLSETTIVLLGVFLVKIFPDLVYASIPRSRVAAVGMNPSGLQILQKAAQIGL